MELNFQELLAEARESFVKNGWVQVYRQSKTSRPGDHEVVYGVLIPLKNVEKELEWYSWNTFIDSGKPGLIFYWEQGEEQWRYDRFSGSEKEPLIINRSYLGKEGSFFELSEEMRLYYNLFEENHGSKKSYFFIDDNGDYDEMAVFSENEIVIKLKYLKDYISVKKMCLLILFEGMKFSEKSPAELGVKEKDDTQSSGKMIYNHFIRDITSMCIRKDRTQSWIIGKTLIEGIEDYRPPIIGQFREAKYEQFLIGYDKNGKEQYFTCEEQRLSNNFLTIEGAPHFLTPVYFDRDVLKKYYYSPHKYTVEDGYINHKGFWGLRVDNNCEEYVVVFLGDLGRIPYKEQLYWKSHNIPPGKGMSSTNIRRALLGEFADPVSEEHFFKQKYHSFRKNWFDKFGWDLFMPLVQKDEHYFTSLHIPSRANAKEFEEQVLSLTKIIIDSLHEKELAKMTGNIPKEAKGIMKFDLFLKHMTGKNYNTMIEFLSMLQSLRSTNVAHRKSREENKKVIEYFKLDEKDYFEVFSDILLKTIWIFNTLESTLLREKA